MKNITLLLTTLLTSIYAYSQTKVEGKISDISNNPIEFANVIITDVNNSTIAGTITDEKGSFNLECSKGNYTITVSMMGYNNYSKSIDTNSDINLDNIVIESSSSELGEVVVYDTKKVYERKVDRLVFNIGNSANANATDMLSLLKKTPGVLLQQDKISLMGKEGVTVMVDGRLINLSGEDLYSYVVGLSSENIERIEIIETPPAKYDAEGNSGMINIVLKKSAKDFFNNSVSASYRQTRVATYSAGVNTSFKKDKLSMLGSLNVRNGARSPLYIINNEYPEQKWKSKSGPSYRNKSFSTNIGADYAISENISIGLLYTGRGAKGRITEKGETSVYSTSTLDSIINSNSDGGSTSSSNMINLHYIHKIGDAGKELQVDIDYFNSKKGKEINIDSYTSIPEITDPTNNKSLESIGDFLIENYSAKFDFTHPTEKIKMSYGAKFGKTSNYSFNSNKLTPDNHLDSEANFKYIEKILAGYFSGSIKFSEKLKMKVGLRAEYTDTYSKSSTKDYADSYLKLFPTVYFMYKKNDDNSFSLSFNKRLSRPAYWELDPFKYYTNAYIYTEGNPFLKPSYTNKISFTYNYHDMLITEVYASRDTDLTSQISHADPETKVTRYFRENYRNKNSIALVQSFNYSKLNWFESNNKLLVKYSEGEIKDMGFSVENENSILAGFFTSNNTFYFNKDKTISANLDFWYMTPTSNFIYDMDATFSMDIGVKYILLDRNLILSIDISDVLGTNIYYMNQKVDGVISTGIYNQDNRYIRFALKYKFGNKDVFVKKRSGGNKDEISRAKM